MPKDTVHLSRFLFLWDEMVHERFSLHNHGIDTARFVLALGFGSDFADIFEVRASASGGGARCPRSSRAIA